MITADSSLWTNPASDEDFFVHLEIDRDQLTRITQEVRNDSKYQEDLERRLAPYRTKVTAKTLYTLLNEARTL